MASEFFWTQQSRQPEYSIVFGIKFENSLPPYEAFNVHLGHSSNHLALQFLDLLILMTSSPLPPPTPTIETAVNWNRCLNSLPSDYNLSKALMTPLFLPLFFDHGTSILSRSFFPVFSFQHWTPWQKPKPLFASIFKFPATTHSPCVLLHPSSKIWYLISAAVFFFLLQEAECYWRKSYNHTNSCNSRLTA